MELLTEKISLLDKKGEGLSLTEVDVITRRDLFEEVWKKLKMKESLLYQNLEVKSEMD